MRDILRILNILTRQGFTNQSLRAIMLVFLDNHVPLSETLRYFDMMTTESGQMSVEHNGKTTVITFKS